MWIEEWDGGRASDSIPLSRGMPSGDFLTFLCDGEKALVLDLEVLLLPIC